MSACPIIKFSDVNFAYEDGVKVLENINFKLNEGEFACIVGPNGGGKSTLLKLILGLIRPQTGSVEIFGKNPIKKRSDIGYVPQFCNFEAGFPVSVLDVVLMGTLNKSFFWGRYSNEQRQAALKAIEETGIIELTYKTFSELSGGQKQRALIARALVSQPKLLLLDEPTASVDVHGTEQFYRMFEELNKRFTILMVSHDIGFVSKRVKSVICIRKTLQIHPVSELTGETLQSIYGVDAHIRHDHRCSQEGHSCQNS